MRRSIRLGLLAAFIAAPITSQAASPPEGTGAETRQPYSKVERTQWRVTPNKVRGRAAAVVANDPQATDSAVRPVDFEHPIVSGASSGYSGESEWVHSDGSNGCDCHACQGSSSIDTACDSDCVPDRGGPIGLWVRGEYLNWTLDGSDLPPLVTTSDAGTTPENTGILNRNTTDVLFGNRSVLDDSRSGARLSLGWFENESRNVGYELSYLGLDDGSERYSVSSTQTPRIARPVFNTTTDAESAQLVAHPDFLRGSISIDLDSELQFIEIMRRHRYWANQCQQFDWLIGYRHGRLDESLGIDQSSTYTAARGPIVSGTTIDLFDRFSAENRFHGAQFGFDFQQHNGCWSLGMLAKVALGFSSTQVTIDGSTTNTVPNAASSTFTGGLLAQSTNIGTYDDTEFAVIPEAGLRLTNQFTRNLQFSAGYNVVYWAGVARVTDQIDRSVSQFPPEPPSGDQRPGFDLETTGLLIHGGQAGVTYQF